MKKRQSTILAASLGFVCIVLIGLGVLQPSDPKMNLAISFNPAAPTSDVWVRLDADDPLKPDGADPSYYWDLGDGTEETGGTVYHRFAVAGTYSIRLTTTDKRGDSKTIVRHITVESPDYNVPIAEFTYHPSSPVEGEIISFQALAICRPECTVIEYTWDFGDGRSYLGAAQRYSFTEAGTYAVRLVMTDITGGEGEAIREVTILAANN